MRYAFNICGKTYNKLTAVKFKKKGRNGHYWVFKCECGIQKTILKKSVMRGATKSCGCWKRKERIGKHKLSHHKLYGVWQGIKNRCYNENIVGYKWYGGRGVKMCDEWLNNFIPFYNWCIKNGWEVGANVDKDLRGNGLLYSPRTCSIITPKQNTNNRRNTIIIEYRGRKQTLMEWSEELKIKYNTLQSRLRYGWGIDKLFIKK